MKQKITVLLEVKFFFWMRQSSINADILDGTSLYFIDETFLWIQWSSINSDIPGGTLLYLNQIF